VKKTTSIRIISVFMAVMLIFGSTNCVLAVDESYTVSNSSTLASIASLTMSGSGSVSSGILTIYYPVQHIGTITVLKNNLPVTTFSANTGSGVQSYSHSLTAGNYSLTFTEVVGGVPQTTAQGTLIIST